MNPSDRRIRDRKSLIRVLVWTAVGTSVMSGTLGYASGNNTHSETFSTYPAKFVDGLVVGTSYRRDYEEWKALDPQPLNDVRSEPAQRCAGSYFPEDGYGMAGCIQALTDKPVTGYHIPRL